MSSQAEPIGQAAAGEPADLITLARNIELHTALSEKDERFAREAECE
jgi:hypothetical protein